MKKMFRLMRGREKNVHLRKIWMTMKLTMFLFFLAITQMMASEAYSQTTKMTLQLENVAVKQVLDQIEDKSEFFFLYNSKLVDVYRIVSVDVKDQKIDDILNTLFRETEVVYTVVDRQIVLTNKADQAGFIRQEGQQPGKKVTGKVADQSGAPIPGASVVVKGTTTGVTTDNDGNFSLALPVDAKALLFSFVGMRSQEVEVLGKTSISIILDEEPVGIDEVVVTGYSSQRKKDITGSVSVVDVKTIKSIPTGSALTALQGQVAGVNIINSGVPGSKGQIFIRGIGSFGDVTPLILVDGVEQELNQVNANEIESVQVLKDAGAASIYGVRGSNGVIIVTTKKGNTSTPVITYDAYYGMQVPLSGNPFNLLNSEDYARLFNIVYPTSSLFKNGLPDYTYRGSGSVIGTGMEGDSEVNPSKYYFDSADPTNNYIIQKVNKTGTNWFQEVFSPAPTISQNLSASGGTDKAKYLFSLGYLNQKGTLMETFQKRYSVRINSDFKIGKNISIGENVYLYTRSNNGFDNLSESNAISNIYRQMPIIPVYDIGGHFGGMYAGPDLGNAQNPVAIQKRQVNNRNNNWLMSGNVYAEATLLKNFKVRTSYGGSVGNSYSVNFAFNEYNNRETLGGLNSLSEDSGFNQYTIWTNTLNYANTFGKHQLAVLAGAEAIQYTGRSLSGSRSDFISTDFDYLILDNGSQLINNSSSAYRTTLFSLFSRLDYSYNDKYLIGLTVRRDGSSKFGVNNRYGLFPSISLGWRLSKEEFMKNIGWIDDLKIRGSYGILGSDNNVNTANAYTLFGSSISSSYYDIAGTSTSSKQGFNQTRFGNPEVGWEKDIVSNVGLDAIILNNKVELSVEYYKKAINGLLFAAQLPATAGGANDPVVNIGDIKNTGFEVSGKYRGNIAKKLNFTIGGYISTYKNEIVNIPGSAGYFNTASSRNGTVVRNQKGHPIGSFFGYKIKGLFQSDADVEASPAQSEAAPGRFKYEDVTSDGRITSDDRTFIGNPNPDFTYGLNLELNYKSFDCSAIFYGSQGNEVFNQVKWYTHFWSWYRGGRSNDCLNAWSTENPTSTIPKIEADGGFSSSGVVNSYYVENGSFLKLRTLTLGYKVSPAFLNQYKLKGLRVYLQATNLFQVTKYSGLDPEIGGSTSSFGIDNGNYPNNEKSFIVGVNLSF